MENRNYGEALLTAARTGDIELGKRILTSGQDYRINHYVDFEGKNVLILAMEEGHVEFARILLTPYLEREIIDINEVDNIGCTALMRAAGPGHVECVRFLLDTLRASDNIKENDEGEATTLLVDSVQCPSTSKLAYSVNMEDMFGATAFMIAAFSGCLNCMKCLFETGVILDINKVDTSDGTTVLHKVSASGNPDCIEYLLNTGMIKDVDEEDKNGVTPFMHAAMSTPSVRSVEFLFATGQVKDINKKDASGATAFMGSSCIPECCRFFLDIMITDETQSGDECQIINSIPSGHPDRLCYRYLPDIRWKAPYIYEGHQQEQPVLHLQVHKGFPFLGPLDGLLGEYFGCQRDALDHQELHISDNHGYTALMYATSFSPNFRQIDYQLQCERIRFHILVVLFREGIVRTNQISLALYKTLCNLILDLELVGYFLRSLCDVMHISKCVDFLLSAFICRTEFGFNALTIAADEGEDFLGLLLEYTSKSDHPIIWNHMKRVFQIPSNVWVEDHLKQFINLGVFQWSWYPAPGYHPEVLAYLLVTGGYTPEPFEFQGRPSSPLHHAFWCGSDSLVRYLVANFYLTLHDLEHLQGDARLRDHVTKRGSVALQVLHRDICATPWRLETVSLVKISSLLTMKRRTESLLDNIPIPRVFKTRLAFMNPIRLLPYRDWHQIDLNLEFFQRIN